MLNAKKIVKKFTAIGLAVVTVIGSVMTTPVTQVEAGFRDTNIDCGQVQTFGYLR